MIAKPLKRAALRTTRRILSGDERRFIRWHDRLDRGRAADRATDGLEGDAARVLIDLRRDGFARWPGVFADPAFLDDARVSADEILDRARRSLSEAPPGGRAHDERSSAEFWKGSNPQDGRTRANFDAKQRDGVPDALSGVFDHGPLASVVRGYYGIDSVWCGALLVEELAGSKTADAWHFDKLFDQVKVMILLEDATEEQGPLRYKLGTHRRPPELDFLFHRSFKGGPHDGLCYNYPPMPLVDKLGGEVALGTGRAGDAIVFDTLGVHSGSICWSGRRLALVMSFNARTAKNDAIYELFFPERAA
ncbi:MAG: phytanoyl-CoA dioxygenase family protein [Planctomycetota bacterium]